MRYFLQTLIYKVNSYLESVKNRYFLYQHKFLLRKRWARMIFESFHASIERSWIIESVVTVNYHLYSECWYKIFRLSKSLTRNWALLLIIIPGRHYLIWYFYSCSLEDTHTLISVNLFPVPIKRRYFKGVADIQENKVNLTGGYGTCSM